MEKHYTFKQILWLRKMLHSTHFATLIYFFLMAVPILGISQGASIQWQNTIGGDNNDIAFAIQQTSDFGYIIAGTSLSNNSGDKTENSQGGADYWVIKLDAVGNMMWQNTIGGNGNDSLFSIQQTSDGGYILAGSSDSGNSGDKTENSLGVADYWVVKLDAVGNLAWQNTIGGSGNDRLASIQQTTDGGYILGGDSDSNISGDKTENSLGGADYWVVKLDAVGNMVWQNTIGGNGNDSLFSIQQTSDGGYILSGISDSGNSGDKTENSLGVADYWVVKLDAVGNLAWQNTIGGSGNDRLASIQQTTDGGYILGGDSDSNISGDKTENSLGGADYWIVKLDAVGNMIWQNTIGGSGNDNASSIQQTSDGGYILSGSSDSNNSGDKTENSLGGADYWVLKLDAVGNLVWQNTIGGSGTDILNSIKNTQDGEFILVGESNSNISGNKVENSQGLNDIWVIKISNTINISINSGNWEDLTTWSLNRIPIKTDNVIIDENHVVIINTDGAKAKSVKAKLNSKLKILDGAKLTIP
jgi:hypothetical protein